MEKYYYKCVVYPFIASLVLSFGYMVNSFLSGGPFFVPYFLVISVVIGILAALAFLPVMLLDFEEKKGQTFNNWLCWWGGPAVMMLVLGSVFYDWVLDEGVLFLSPYLIGGTIGRQKFIKDHRPEGTDVNPFIMLEYFRYCWLYPMVLNFVLIIMYLPMGKYIMHLSELKTGKGVWEMFGMMLIFWLIVGIIVIVCFLPVILLEIDYLRKHGIPRWWCWWGLFVFFGIEYTISYADRIINTGDYLRIPFLAIYFIPYVVFANIGWVKFNKDYPKAESDFI